MDAVASNRSLKDKGQTVLPISSTTIKCNCEKPHKSNGSDSETNEEIKIKFSSDSSSLFQDDPSKGCLQVKCDPRALSPKLSLHKSGFQQAIIISDESELTKSPRIAPSSADNQFYRQLNHKISKSEQTSPNNVEIDKANFLYEANNRSTGCLVYPSDPWIKNADIKGSNSPKAERHFNLHHNTDLNPWVRRHTEEASAVEVVSRLPKKNIYREKSLSSINHKLLSTRTEKSKCVKPQLKHSNTAIDDPTEDHVFLNEPGLLFAPFSPQYRNASQKTWSLDQSKSASYIPDKVKEISSPLPTHVRKSVYQNTNSNLLCPNDQALHSRHSSLSIPTQSKEEELPLNIRRLSEQIREPPLERNLSLSLSDRNVSKVPAPESAGDREPHKTKKKKPDKFKANRDAAVQIEEKLISLERAIKDSASVNNVNPFTTNYKPDPLLETTC